MKVVYKYIVLALIIIIIIISSLMVLKFNLSNNEIKNFNVKDYQYVINWYNNNKENFLEFNIKNIRSIEDKNTAIKTAKTLWKQIYNEIPDEIEIYYDNTNKLWLLKGILQKNEVGGVPYLIVKKTNGEIVAIYHDK